MSEMNIELYLLYGMMETGIQWMEGIIGQSEGGHGTSLSGSLMRGFLFSRCWMVRGRAWHLSFGLSGDPTQ